MEKLETIEILSRNKIAWLRSNGVQEIDKKIVEKDGKVFVAYIYPATEQVEDALMEYKYSYDLQSFVRSFKEISYEMYLFKQLEEAKCI